MPHLNPAADWAEAVQTVVQILGFLFVIWQVRELQKSLHSTTHSNIYTHYTDTVRWFLDKPHLYPYFRENKPLKGSVPDSEEALRRAEVLTLCELTTTLFEHAILEKHNMPSRTWECCWMPYIKASYENSEELRLYFEANRGFYVPEYGRLIDSMTLPFLARTESQLNPDRK